jgi:hypothetical protein
MNVIEHRGTMGADPFIVVCAVAAIAFLPGTQLTILAGFLFSLLSSSRNEEADSEDGGQAFSVEGGYKGGRFGITVRLRSLP